MDKKQWIIAGLIIVAALSGVALFSQNIIKDSSRQNTKANDQISVVSTFYPLAFIAERVGGDFVVVTNSTPAGAEPHDYEPTPRDLIKIYGSKVFVLNGGGVDAWAEKMKPDLEAKGVLVVNMQSSIPFMDAPVGAEAQSDPHIWLDPVLMQREAELIRDAFIAVDPAHTDRYKKNANDVLIQLRELDSRFRAGLASCKLRDIVTSHAAFGYMAKRYGLNQISLTGLSPDAEPSVRQLAEIARLAKKKNIKYIFFETLVSPKLSETIAREIGAQTIAFNPLEGLTDEEIKSGKTYLSEMENNLKNLQTALLCS